MANVIRVGRAESWRHRDEVDELLMRIKGLVFARAILDERGVDTSVHSREIEKLREQLAQIVRRDGVDAAA
jgi:hypothetical protein